MIPQSVLWQNVLFLQLEMYLVTNLGKSLRENSLDRLWILMTLIILLLFYYLIIFITSNQVIIIIISIKARCYYITLVYEAIGNQCSRNSVV